MARSASTVRRFALATILIFWTAQFSTLSLMRYLRFPDQGFQYLVPRGIVTAAGVMLSLAILFVHLKARAASLPMRTLLAVAIAMLGCVLHGVVNEIVFANLHSSVFTLADFIVAVVDWFWFYLSLSVMILVLSYSADLIDSRVQIESLKAETTLAQLSALRYQLNPHFLFNALNSIAALVVDRQPEQAERMINRLSDFLRAGLDTDPIEEVSLDAEISQQRRYLEIEQIRFPNRLAFSFEVDEEIHDALVPSLILQPLVENAIKFGVAPSPELVTVTIVATRTDDQLHIVVSDDGATAAAGSAGSGIGLENVRRRLASSFGDAASFASGPLADGGYQVTLRIPLRRSG